MDDGVVEDRVVVTSGFPSVHPLSREDLFFRVNGFRGRRRLVAGANHWSETERMVLPRGRR